MPDMPGWQWWSSWGVLGIAAFVCASAAVVYFGSVHLPHAVATKKQERQHVKAKQELELKREEKLTLFIDRLSETHGEEVEYKRQSAAILDRMDKRQTAHSDSCEKTHKLTERIASDVTDLKARLA